MRGSRLILPLVLAACASGQERVDSTFPPRAERISRASAVREVAASAQDAGLTSVFDLAVDSRGNIFVPDPFAHRVVVLGPDGAVQRTLGRRGEGPGEYRMIRNVQALPGDSLLVYDPELARVTIYAPGANVPAYTTALGGALTRGIPFTLRRTSGNDAFLAVLRPGFAFGQGTQNTNRRERVVVLDLDGRERRELVDYPAAARLVAGTSIMQHPFGRDGFARLDSRDRLHFLWADSLARAGGRAGGPVPGDGVRGAGGCRGRRSAAGGNR